MEKSEDLHQFQDLQSLEQLDRTENGKHTDELADAR
ncbi:MAG: hypothetical protein RL413_1354 [Actinomycetota bacterium]